MLVDAETLLPARDGWSRVFGEATGTDPAGAVRIVRRDHDAGVRDGGRGRGGAARAAARGRGASGGARATPSLAIGLASDGDRAGADRAARALRADAGGARPEPQPPGRRRPARPRVRSGRGAASARSRASSHTCRACLPLRRTRPTTTAWRADGARFARRSSSRCRLGRDAGGARELGRRAKPNRASGMRDRVPTSSTLEVRVMDQPTSVRPHGRARGRGAAACARRRRLGGRAVRP